MSRFRSFVLTFGLLLLTGVALGEDPKSFDDACELYYDEVNVFKPLLDIPNYFFVKSYNNGPRDTPYDFLFIFLFINKHDDPRMAIHQIKDENVVRQLHQLKAQNFPEFVRNIDRIRAESIQKGDYVPIDVEESKSHKSLIFNRMLAEPIPTVAKNFDALIEQREQFSVRQRSDRHMVVCTNRLIRTVRINATTGARLENPEWELNPKLMRAFATQVEKSTPDALELLPIEPLPDLRNAMPTAKKSQRRGRSQGKGVPKSKSGMPNPGS